MSTVRELLISQQSEIEGKLDPLLEQRNSLWKSVMEVEEAIAKYRQELQKIKIALKAVEENANKTRPTIMQAVMEVLKDKPEGLTAQEILAEINTRYFDGAIIRPSLSPQLSRLKDRDKKIEYRNGRWIRLPEQPSLFRRRF